MRKPRLVFVWQVCGGLLWRPQAGGGYCLPSLPLPRNCWLWPQLCRPLLPGPTHQGCGVWVCCGICWWVSAGVWVLLCHLKVLLIIVSYQFKSNKNRIERKHYFRVPLWCVCWQLLWRPWGAGRSVPILRLQQQHRHLQARQLWQADGRVPAVPLQHLWLPLWEVPAWILWGRSQPGVSWWVPCSAYRCVTCVVLWWGLVNCISPLLCCVFGIFLSFALYWMSWSLQCWCVCMCNSSFACSLYSGFFIFCLCPVQAVIIISLTAK